MKLRSSILAAILLVACNRQEVKHQPSRPARPISLAKSAIRAVTPTADGGAYITTLDAGLWYVRGVEAVRVHFNYPAPQSDERKDLALLEITPAVDGSAYAASPVSERLWYLKEGQAFMISESPSITSKTYQPSGDRFFNSYIVELKKRRAASKNRGYDSNGTDDAEYEQ